MRAVSNFQRAAAIYFSAPPKHALVLVAVRYVLVAVRYVVLVLLLGLALVSSPQVSAQGDVAPLYARDEILVRFAAGVSAGEAQAAVAQIGASVTERFDIVENLYLVKLAPPMTPADAIAAFKTQGGTLYAEPNYTLRAFATPNDSRFSELWGLHNTGQSGGTTDADIDAPEAWDITTGSSSVVVAVVDTGIDYNHPDLAANMIQNETNCADGVDNDGNGHVDDCYGLDTINNDTNPMDDNRHGTHVAGTIGATGNNSVGVVGVNWNVKLMACKFLNASGSGSTSNAVKCLSYIATMKDRGVNIVATNNSWGGGGFSQSLEDAIDVQRQKGILFIAAAGNSTTDHDLGNVYPASHYLPNIIAVASQTRTNMLSSFSDFGRRTVHLGAPGSAILSTTLNNSYTSLSGTSMATPHVAGVAALLKAQDSTRDWRAIRNLILAGGSNASALAGTTVTGKRLNAAGSLSCSNSVVRERLRPAGATIVAAIGETVALAMLHINCAAPNGDATVSVSGGGLRAQATTLVDNGVAPDQVAGDGIYSGQTSFSTRGKHTLTFPGGDVVDVQVLRTYKGQATSFSYRDITGTSLDVSLDRSKTLNTPFPILFGGGSFTSLFLSPNGIAGASASHVDFINATVPTTDKKAFIAAFWDDLYPTTGGTRNVFWAVLGTSPNRELVIEWRNLPHYDCRSDSSVSVKFQLVFLEGSSRVIANYADTVMGGACTAADRGGSATVGIQIGASDGTQWSRNAKVIDNNMALLWTSGAAFTDATLTSVGIKAVHITELRTRIDAVRTARGLAAFSWTDPSLTTGSTVIKAVHMQELRSALNEAYTASGQTLPAYTDPAIVAGSTVIKSVHITELRSAVTSLE